MSKTAGVLANAKLKNCADTEFMTHCLNSVHRPSFQSTTSRKLAVLSSSGYRSVYDFFHLTKQYSQFTKHMPTEFKGLAQWTKSRP
jgi:hypothetical protein